MKTQLSLDSIGELANGAAREIIDAALNVVATDLDDRGSDKKKRQVVITLEFVQLSNEKVDATVQAIPKVPAYKTPSTFAELRRKEGKAALVFQDDHREPDHDALPGMESDKAKK